MITKRKDVSTFQEVRQFIERNFAKDILVECLCKEFGLNRTKLQEGFNQLFGTSVHAFVSRARMDKAREMLLQTDDPVKSIAIECGYRSASSFIRIFSRQNNLSPTQYRSLVLSNQLPSEKFDGSDN